MKITKPNQGYQQPCPKCRHKKTGVIDTRSVSEPFYHTRRRRVCPACDYRFSTREIICEQDDLYGFMADGAENVVVPDGE